MLKFGIAGEGRQKWVGFKNIQDAEVTTFCTDQIQGMGKSEDASDSACFKLYSCCPPCAVNLSEWISILARSKHSLIVFGVKE